MNKPRALAALPPRALAALLLALLLLTFTACAVEKQEKQVEDFEAAISKTGYTLYEDNEDYEGKGLAVDRAMVALSEDEGTHVEFFQCADPAAAQRLYESFGTDIASACSLAEHCHEKEFTGDNYQCHGAQCDETYYYRVRVGSTLLWASGSETGREEIAEVVLELGY